MMQLPPYEERPGEDLLTKCRRIARETQQQPDVILAEDMAVLLEDMARSVDGICPGFLRRQPRHQVRAAKVQRPVVDAVEGEA